MSTTIDSVFFFDAIKFLIAIIVAFYIPGAILLRNTQIQGYSYHILSFLTGMGIWPVIGTVLGLLRFRQGMYVYILICFVFFVWKNRNVSKLSIHKLSVDPIVVSIIFFGGLIQILGVWLMGISTQRGIIGCCGHVQDNTLFLSITNELVHRFPPQEPGITGIPLNDYHYLGHLAIAELVRIFHLPLVATTYQFMSIVLSLSLGMSAYIFSKVLNTTKKFLRWLLFFLYFGADAVFLFVLLLNKQFMFYFAAMESGAGFLFNYPRSFSIIFLLTGLSLLILFMKEKRWELGILSVFIFSSTLAYKAYTGVFVWAGMAALFLWSIVRRESKIALLAVCTVLAGFLLFMPGSGVDSGGMFFSGLWRVHDFFAMPELGLSHWLLARNVFLEHQNLPRIWILDSVMFILFLLVTFGTKLISVFQTKRSLSVFPFYIHAFFAFAMSTSFIAGMFFLQKLGGSTSVNFLITTVIMISVYAALTCAYSLTMLQKNIHRLFIVLIICMTVPRSLYVAYENSTRYSRILIPKADEIFFRNVRAILPDNSVILPVGYTSDYGELYLSYMVDRKIYVLASMNSQIAKEEEKNRRMLIALVEHNQINVIEEMRKANISHILYKKKTQQQDDPFPFAKKILNSSCCALYEIYGL